jgi:hypothetical protein
MRHKLKAVFDDRGKAQQALDELLASGFAHADTGLVTIQGACSGSVDETPAPSWPERPGTSTARLLSRLLGQPDSRPLTADARPDAADSHVLTLSTDSAQEAERAASLVCGFMYLQSEDAGAGMSAGSAGMNYVVHRRSAEPGALQFYAPDTSHYFGTHDANDACMTGTTFRGPMLPKGHWPDLSPANAALEDGHSSPPNDGRAADAAYRFGHDMHENERYRNRSWHEADADLKLLWEAGTPGMPGWDRSEAAIRLGWDSTSPEIDDDSYHRSHWRTGYADSSQGAGAARPGSNATSAAARSRPTQGHPGELTAWANFMDAVKHGWSRVRIGNDMDEADYRLHHAHTYPGTNYEDLAPVYRYGHQVRNRSMFQGRNWDEAESELRAEWERGHREGKPSTWDEVKPALQRGWGQTAT